MLAPKEYEIRRKKLKDEQWRKLKKLLKVVLATNKFYQKKYAKVGVKSAEDIKTWDDFYKLPLTTREELVKDQEKNPPLGTNLSVNKEKYYFAHPTSGTSSKRQFITYWTERDFNEMVRGITDDFLSFKICQGDRMYMIHPRVGAALLETEALKNIGATMLTCSQGADFSEILKEIFSLKTTVLKGSPSSVLNLVNIAQKEKINIKKNSSIKKIIVVGETLLPSMKKIIEEFWHCRCYNYLISVEIKPIAHECLGEQLHLAEDNNIIEIKNINSINNINGEIIATSLLREDYPFIRYQTGDYIETSIGDCNCNSISPRIINNIVRRIDSRLKFEDVFFYPDEIEEIVRKFSKTKEYQIELIKEKGIDKMIIRIEMPFIEEKNIIPKIKNEIEKTFAIYPKIISVDTNSFVRSIWKSKRFIDNRYQNSNSQIKFLNKRPSNYFRKILRKTIYFLLGGWE